MRSSFMALITCIGSISIMHHIFTNYSFAWWWIEPLAIVLTGILTMLVLHVKEILCVGSAGLSIFLLHCKDDVFSHILQREPSLIENILITLAIIIVVTISTEILVSTSLTIVNIVFDIILAILTISLILWIFPLLAETVNISHINILAKPIILLVYFILIIMINFKANFRDSKVVTESKLTESSEEE